MNITFGDNVKVLITPESEGIGVAGKLGSVYGETTPSQTNVEVVGKPNTDYAINVFFEDIGKSIWFAEEQLEFVDHGAGIEMSIGNIKSVRNADGTWKETKLPQSKKWWQFWK